MTIDLADTLVAVGAVLVVGGLAWIALPLAVVGAGVLVMAFGIVLAMGRR